MSLINSEFRNFIKLKVSNMIIVKNKYPTIFVNKNGVFINNEIIFNSLIYEINWTEKNISKVI